MKICLDKIKSSPTKSPPNIGSSAESKQSDTTESSIIQTPADKNQTDEKTVAVTATISATPLQDEMVSLWKRLNETADEMVNDEDIEAFGLSIKQGTCFFHRLLFLLVFVIFVSLFPSFPLFTRLYQTFSLSFF